MDDEKIKYLLKLARQNKELRKKNENLILGKIMYEEELSKFHKPVVEKLKEQKESQDESLKSIQDALKNIHISESSRLHDIDEGLNHAFLEQQDYKLPSQLRGDPAEIKETLAKLKTDCQMLGTYKGRWNKKIDIKKYEIGELRKQLNEDLSKQEAHEIKKEIEKKSNELERLKRQLEAYETDLTEFKIYREKIKSLSSVRGEGLVSQLDKLTDKLVAGTKSKKVYNQIVSILDLLLNEGSITNDQIKQYYENFLTK